MQGSRRTWSSPNTLHVALCLHAANPLAMDETACSSAPLVTCSFGSDVKRLSGLRSPNRKKWEMENNAFGWTQISSMWHLLIFFAEPSLCENQNHHDSHRKPTVKKYEKLLTCKRSSRFIDMLSFPKAFRRNFHRKWYEMVTRSSFLEVIPTPGTMDAKYIDWSKASTFLSSWSSWVNPNVPGTEVLQTKPRKKNEDFPGKTGIRRRQVPSFFVGNWKF